MACSDRTRSHQVQTCGRAFRNKETLYTLLRDERNAYLRVDVCEPCWAQHYAEGANHQRGFVSFWQSQYSAPQPEPEPIRRETAETLLRKLLEQQAPEHAPACFILAAMLERKRLLKMKGQTTEADRRLLIYEHSKTGDVFAIADPKLQLDQLEAVQRDVARLLEHGLEPPAPSAPEQPQDESAPPDSGPAEPAAEPQNHE